jgi:hypothetical protein
VSGSGQIRRNRVADRPALDKANQQAKGHLNRQDRRQDRPREIMAWPTATKKRHRTVFGADQFMRALKYRVVLPCGRGLISGQCS